MKAITVLKSLDDLSPEVIGVEVATPAPASPKPNRVAEHQPQETQSPIPVPEYSGFAGYRHWGLNE
jgi:hypothetical protein